MLPLSILTEWQAGVYQGTADIWREIPLSEEQIAATGPNVLPHSFTRIYENEPCNYHYQRSTEAGGPTCDTVYFASNLQLEDGDFIVNTTPDPDDPSRENLLGPLHGEIHQVQGDPRMTDLIAPTVNGTEKECEHQALTIIVSPLGYAWVTNKYRKRAL